MLGGMFGVNKEVERHLESTCHFGELLYLSGSKVLVQKLTGSHLRVIT